MAKMYTEAHLQKDCVRWFNQFYAEYRGLFFRIKNEEGKNDVIKVMREKALGVVAGVPDMFLSVPAGDYHGLYVEFKAPGGVLSERQVAIHAIIRKWQYQIAIIKTLEEFKTCITQYLPCERAL